jgi:MFS family permease
VDSRETARAGASVPAALAEPAEPVPARWIALLFGANVGLWLAIYAPIQVLLPEQVAALHPAGKAALLSVVMAAGAIASLLANPVVGALSDRTTSRPGSRHPWTAAGALTAAAGLAVLAAAPGIAVMLLGWCIAQAGLGGMLATLTSALPDRVPARQRGALPAAQDRAKDLGVMNIGYSLPLDVAPAIAGVVLGLLHSYRALFGLAGLATIAAAATIARVRAVR